MAGVLLDHVHEDPTQVDGAAPVGAPWRARSRSVSSAIAARLRSTAASNSSAATARGVSPAALIELPVRAICMLQSTDAHGSRGRPTSPHVLNHWSSTSVMCLSRPPIVSVDGASRSASWACGQSGGFAQQHRPVVVEHADQRVDARRPWSTARLPARSAPITATLDRSSAVRCDVCQEMHLSGLFGEYRHMSNGCETNLGQGLTP